MLEHDWFWGIDLRTDSVAIGCVRDDLARTAWFTLDAPSGLRGAPRLTALRTEVLDAIAAWANLAAPWARPSAAALETPNIRRVDTRLMFTAGVVFEAIHAATRCAIIEQQSAEWKKPILGHGNADKSDSVAHAREHLSYTGRDDNEADALCLAARARGLYLRDYPAERA